MRASFRHERKIRKREETATEALKDRLGTDIELLPESEQDVKRAKLITFGDTSEIAATSTSASRPFGLHKSLRKSSTKSKTQKRHGEDALRDRILGNTRARLNPF
jgi:coiled-coil domain-containing protein 130